MKLQLHRTEYIDKITPYISKHIIKVITGMRRTGKSTLLEQIVAKYDDASTIFIHREWSEYHFLTSDAELTPYLEERIRQGGITLLCVDEVQLVKNWERSINAIYAKYSDIDIILTGSNSDLLSGELATLLSGRYIEFQIFPFAFHEYCKYFNKEMNEVSFGEYITFSGLPSLYELSSEENIQTQWIDSLKDTIFLKDIVSRYAVRDVFLLEELFLWFANNMGNISNPSKLTKILTDKGITTNHNTIGNYIEYMRRAFLIYEVPMYDLRGKQIFDHERKFYLADHIFRKKLFSGYDTGLSKALENIIFMEGLRRGYDIFVGRWDDKEIDFVLEKNGKKIYIQVAYILTDETVIEREFGNLQLIRDNWPKYVVTLDPLSHGIIDGIEHVRAWEMDRIFSE